MDYIDKISHLYKENILLHSPYKGSWKSDFPQDLCSIFQLSNGIEETIPNPKTGERIPIARILYSYEEIMEESDFYKIEYGIEGFIFTDDGAGNPYVLKSDGTVTCYDIIDGEEIRVANSLSDFYN